MESRPAPDEMHRLRVDARKAIEQIDWTNENSFWLRLLPQIAEGLAVPELVEATETWASLVLNRTERWLIRQAWRSSPWAGADVMPTAAAGDPVSLTLAEWTYIRAALVQVFCQTKDKRKQTLLERLIVRIEQLFAGIHQPGLDTTGPAPPDAGPDRPDPGPAQEAAQDQGCDTDGPTAYG